MKTLTAYLLIGGVIAHNAFGLLLDEAQVIELTADERARLAAPPSEMEDEIMEGEEERQFILRGDIEIPVEGEGELASGFTGTKWTGGIVYYQFNSNVNATNKQRFVDATVEWSNVANLTFIEGTGTGNYIEVISDTGNSSSVGMIGGRQYLRMYNWSYKYIIAHEIAHALGVSHEQSRSDRDTYVTILYENILDGKEHNFDKRTSTNYGAYDFDSVMHYRGNAFLKDGLPSSTNTIEAKPAYAQFQDEMGQRDHLSVLDKQGMADHYGGSASNAELVDRGSSYHGLSSTILAPGQSLTIRGDVSNTGGTAAGAFTVAFYASTNTIISSSDTFLGTKNISGLSDGSYTAIDLNVTLPSSMNDGDYYIGWILDSGATVVEVDEGNNRVHISSPQLTVTSSGAVDLKDDGEAYQSVSATSVEAGSPLSVYSDVRNGGASPSGSFDVAVYLSTNSIISTGDTLLGTVSMSGISAGAWANADLTNAIVPAGLTAGTYYIGWIIDSGSAISETDESNNTVLFKSGNTTITVTAPAGTVDLHDDGEIYQSVTSTSVMAGQTMTVKSDIRNSGNALSVAFDVSVYLSTNNFISTSDTFIGTVNMGALSPGSWAHCDLIDAVVPGSLAPGVYYLGWIIDSGSSVVETDEGNNRVVYKSGTVTITVSPPATTVDLKDDGESYQMLSATSVLAGTAITVKSDIRNGGTGASGAFDVNVYLSTNNIISTADTLLGTVNMETIAAGSWANADLVDAIVPPGLAAGSYYVGWIIDSGGSVSESNEGNNTVVYLSGTVTLTVSAAGTSIDLADDGEQWQYMSKSVVAQGEAFNVGGDISNAGTNASGSFSVGLYLSTNSIISTGDNLLSSIIVPTVGPGSWANADFNDVQIPAGFPPGTYYVGWIIDSEGSIAETNEGNNRILYKSGTETLVVVEATAPPGIQIGSFQYLSDRSTISISMEAGRTYRVMTSTDMVNWSPVSGQTGIAGSGGVKSIAIMHTSVPASPGGSRYFRIEEEP